MHNLDYTKKSKDYYIQLNNLHQKRKPFNIRINSQQRLEFNYKHLWQS